MLGVLLFLVTPLLFLGAYFALLGTVETKVLFLYFTFTLIHTILFSLWFFIVLLDVFEGLKVENMAERKEIVLEESQRMQSGRKNTNRLTQEPNNNIPEMPEGVLQGYQIDKPMTFREDLYSLLFVSLVKPQYKMYCDLVAKTGKKLPYDAKQKTPTFTEPGTPDNVST